MQWKSEEGFEMAVSADGSVIAALSHGQSPQRIRLLDWRVGAERTVTLPSGYFASLWFAPDGRSLLSAAVTPAGNALTRIELDGKIRILLNKDTRDLLLDTPLPSPDGRYLAYTQLIRENNVWLLENF
jgi:hypothetical protein